MSHEFGHLGNLKLEDAGDREGNIMHQAWKEKAGNNSDESEVQKIENFINKKKVK